ncbi:MAG: hypothetical protein PSX37_05535 [bacterium]|nr:hypothetical protein [bacterium]
MPETPHSQEYLALQTVVDFIIHHPYTAYNRPEGPYFSDEFREFVIGMTAPGEPCENLTLREISVVTKVPEETLAEWLR